ncbi:hypothetical protein E1B28_003111 [Marasmius oreades]|uniref:Uncharacterized protein n=1 Tax=Marasmius oreades TaxID=181124 RepID=A0A9P7RKZ6_9AGAR|nr:uncharacterized protein E1B28_003111 [Marasmius oreades]KAG7085554.1 hypothetical protein E1B28_003111 [Marasmius oreades]
MSILISTALAILLWKQDQRERYYLSHIHDLMEYSHVLEGRLADRKKQYDDLKSIAAASQAKYIQLERNFLSNEDQYEQRCRRLEEENTKLVARQRSDIIQPLGLFIERLIMMNKVWQQEREINRLQTCLVKRNKYISGAAFEGFRDRVLLWNAIWKREGEMRVILGENARMKHNMVRSITNAAKKMVLDTRREGMIEELVKELVTEVENGKKERKALKDRYEVNIQETNLDWLKDYRRLLREVETLRLGKRSKEIEQEISNEMEGRLVRALQATRTMKAG